LGDREAFPSTECDFSKPWLNSIVVGRQTKRLAYKLHCFARPSERTRYEIEFGSVAAGAREQVAKNAAAMHCLFTTARIKWNVALALQAAGHIPFGFAVTDIIDGRTVRCRSSHYSFLPTAISGASGCLMPTM